MAWFGQIRNNFSHKGPLNLGLVQNRHFKNYKYIWHSKQFLRQGVFIEQKLVGWKQKSTLETTFIISFGVSFLVLARKFAYHLEIPF